MKAKLILVLILLVATSVGAADKLPLLVDCRKTGDKPLEVQFCRLILEGMAKSNLFYKPDPKKENMALMVTISPLQDNKNPVVGAAITISVIVKNETSSLSLLVGDGCMTTDEERMNAPDMEFVSFWQSVYDDGNGYINESLYRLKKYCGKRGTYAWTKTSKCASMKSAHLDGIALDTRPGR